MVDLELGDLLVLVGRDGDELRLLEHVGAEGAPGQLQHVVGADDVEARLVLVHRIQDGLLETRSGGGGRGGRKGPRRRMFGRRGERGKMKLIIEKTMDV